ncbi:hypothetical protein K505DRAFT_258600 [Melanomma pulvis-pyrius CBS 109.77]|uniref:Zn(2)-C6 fungal-type domain-containing protein n=1 Tax=Melanomma pulvis-pyrius CBS 109.77 TaxID=1314802 RepID=A0A6A6WTA1_9PLEO|nr:hypothetical protein K505DRAFT_258600 [Melanomma pulvis-pyrius CBS 109.77]
MRTVCDACARAKVKCDKVKPTCQRCSNKSISRNYSLSKRHALPSLNTFWVPFSL